MIESARNYVMGQFPPRLETARQLAGTFAMLEANGLDASYINDYGASLLATTPESVAAVINNVYPSSEDLVFIVIGDAELIREQLSAYGSITEISLSAPSFHP
jgi:predicted Zn-dependent peptidase